MNIFKSMLSMMLLASLLFACEDSLDAEVIPSGTVPSATVAHKPKKMLGNEKKGGAFDQYCDITDRIEFDVYDIDPEFTNPKNYELRLWQGGRLVGIRSFDQYCTFNNTVDFRYLSAGSYTYKLTSSCTERIYTGAFEYGGGYYGQVLYIEQWACD